MWKLLPMATRLFQADTSLSRCRRSSRDVKPGMADKIQRASQPGRIKYESAALTVRLLLSEAT